MKNPEIAVVINSYNRLSLLKQAISSLDLEFKKNGLPLIILIFDAFSKDGSIEYIEQYKLTTNTVIKLITPNDSPSSFSYGVNATCIYVKKQYPDIQYYFLYETDNYLRSALPVIQALQLLKLDKSFAGCGFTVKKFNGTDAGFGCKFPSLLSLILGQQISFKLGLHKSKIHWKQLELLTYFKYDVVYTSPLLIKSEWWHSVNGFDYEKFPFSDCDIDLAKRLRMNGGSLIVLKTEDVVHDNRELKSNWSSSRTMNFYKARFNYFRKHYGKWVYILKPILFLMHGMELILLIGLMLIGKRKSSTVKNRLLLMINVWNNYTDLR